jgi:hypothetical protein
VVGVGHLVVGHVWCLYVECCVCVCVCLDWW